MQDLFYDNYDDYPNKIEHPSFINCSYDDDLFDYNEKGKEGDEESNNCNSKENIFLSQYFFKPKFSELSTKVSNFEILNKKQDTNKPNELKDISLIGNKKLRAKKKGKHNKFSDDNLRRTCKHIILENLLNFINNKIREIYNNKIGNGIFIKKLLIINQKQKCDSSAKFNKELLEKSLKDIFSEDISRKIIKYPLNHNRNLINQLMNEEDENKRIYFRKLFNLTFIECLKHFRGSERINELEGLNGFDNIKNKYEKDFDYLQTLNYYIYNYEIITNKKRSKNK